MEPRIDHSVVANPPGNVLSRPVQFAEYKRLDWTSVPGFFDWTLWPLNDDPKAYDGADGLDIDEDEEGEEGSEAGAPKPKEGDQELVPITDKWIYAFETGYKDNPQLAILAREYHADGQGKLTFVDGATRRLVDADEKGAPVGQPTPDAALPHARQLEHCQYVFVGTRGRLSKNSIRDIEQNLAGQPGQWKMPSIYQPVNLGDSLQSAGAKGPWFAPVIDPLTLGENLNRSYRRALNWRINLSVPHQHNPKREEVSTSARKYHLASMIKGTLLRDGDPLEIKPHLTNNGDLMSHFMAQHDIALSKAQKKVRDYMRALIKFHDSYIWSQAKRWYQGARPGPETDECQSIGHFFCDSDVQVLRRFDETVEGAQYIRKKVLHNPDGPIAWLFEPPKDEHKARDLYEKWYPVARKSVTAVVLGIAELGPQLVVTGKIARNSAVMRATLSRLYPASFAAALEHAPKNLRRAVLKLTPQGRGLLLSSDNLDKELKQWLHEGKAHWPHSSKLAKPAHLLSLALAGLELYNLGSTVVEVMDDFAKQDAARRESASMAAMRLTLAGLELVVAAEEPIKEWGIHLARTAEAEKTLGKLLAPATFKVLGCVAGIIEGCIAVLEAREAVEHGESGVASGYRMVAGGAFLTAIGSGIGAATTGAVVTAAALTLVVVGVAAVAIGYLIVACLKTSSWQGFAAHCVFGTNRDNGKTPWSGTEFEEWKETPEGLDIQIRALTAMLCGFKIAGEGSAGKGSTVRLSFGSLPPNAQLQIQFELTLENGVTTSPGYLIDLESRALVHSWGGVSACRQLDAYGDADLASLIVGPDWPAGHWVVKSHCFAVIQYAPQATDQETGVATGTIPAHGPLRYNIIETGVIGIAHTNTLDSLEAN